jgi:hypothetical protein
VGITVRDGGEGTLTEAVDGGGTGTDRARAGGMSLQAVGEARGEVVAGLVVDGSEPWQPS